MASINTSSLLQRAQRLRDIAATMTSSERRSAIIAEAAGIEFDVAAGDAGLTLSELFDQQSRLADVVTQVAQRVSSVERVAINMQSKIMPYGN